MLSIKTKATAELDVHLLGVHLLSDLFHIPRDHFIHKNKNVDEISFNIPKLKKLI